MLAKICNFVILVAKGNTKMVFCGFENPLILSKNWL